MPFCR